MLSTMGNHMKISTKLIFCIVCLGTTLSFNNGAFAECSEYISTQTPDCERSGGCICYVDGDDPETLFARECGNEFQCPSYTIQNEIPSNCDEYGTSYKIVETGDNAYGYGVCEGYVRKIQYRSCTRCKEGYMRVELKTAINMLKQGTATLNGSPRLPCYSSSEPYTIVFDNTYYTQEAKYIYVCVKQQQPTCTDTYGNWTDVRTGYQQRIHTDTSCNTTYQYRCAVGYFGTPTNGTTGCTKCQPIEGIESTTAQPGATSCTSCCISANKTSNDGTGNFEILSQCCHTSPTCK